MRAENSKNTKHYESSACKDAYRCAYRALKFFLDIIPIDGHSRHTRACNHHGNTYSRMSRERQHRAKPERSTADKHANGLYLTFKATLQRRPYHRHSAPLQRRARNQQRNTQSDICTAERQYRANRQQRCSDRRLYCADHQLDLIRYAVPVGNNRAGHRHRASRN